jgi:hypothetical protein
MARAQAADPFKAQAEAQAKAIKAAQRERKRQEAERRKRPPDARIDQILHPDVGQSFNLSKEKRFGTKGYDTSSPNILEFKSPVLPQKFNAKEYMTGSFHGEKAFWMGDFRYSVNAANTAPKSLFFLPGKTYQTKAVPVKGVNDASKNFTDVNSALPTRDFRGGGAFGRSGKFDQQRLDTPLTPEQAAANGYRGDLTELKTIDDVRTLLNKNK